MGSSDEMSDDDQLQWSEEFDDLDEPDDPTRSWRVAMTSSATWGKQKRMSMMALYFLQLQVHGSSEVYTSPSPSIIPTSPSTKSHPVIIHHNTHTPTNTDNCTSWSFLLNPVTIKPFTSQVGPTIPISASPLEVFQVFFSADLMENYCDREQQGSIAETSVVPRPCGRRETALYLLLAHAQTFLLYFRKIVTFTQTVHMKQYTDKIFESSIRTKLKKKAGKVTMHTHATELGNFK